MRLNIDRYERRFTVLQRTFSNKTNPSYITVAQLFVAYHLCFQIHEIGHGMGPDHY